MTSQAPVIEEDFGDSPSLFVDDLPSGHCLVECPCGFEYSTEHTNCPKCNHPLIYPPGASW